MVDTKQILRETRERIAPPTDVNGSLQRRRNRKERVRRGSAAVVAIVVALVGVGGWFALGRDDSRKTADRSDLGIFAPVADRIVYERMVGGHAVGLWAVDPDDLKPSHDPTDSRMEAIRTQVKLNADKNAEPLGWSSDGTELLIKRTIEDEAGGAPTQLYILHADGSETQVTSESISIGGATISPDGSRVVFAGSIGGREGLYAVESEGGYGAVLLRGRDSADALTFSPDGTQIAYVERLDDYGPSVWVMDADGSNAHQIVSNETTQEGFEFGLAWSPTGDRIALGFGGDSSAIYTFAPDGSDFTRVITPGYRPYWSPDGSQIAYTVDCYKDTDGCPSFDGSDGVLAVADADGSHARTFGFATSGPWHPTIAAAGRPTLPA